MSRFLSILLLGAFASISYAVPTPVDLRTWTVEEVPGSGVANWNPNVSPPNYNEVFQNQNSRPSIFFESGSNAQGLELEGTIRVETTGDDDFIGFVLGYEAGDAGSASTDFMLVDWKQLNQSGGAIDGMAISHVTCATHEDDGFWNHGTTSTPCVDEIARATNLGSTGWNDLQTYSFELVFTPNLIQVSVDSILELSITPADAGLTTFNDGAFGFYNYSQASVRYGGVFEDISTDFCEENPTHPNCVERPVPAPTTLALMGLGLLGLSVSRKRKK